MIAAFIPWLSIQLTVEFPLRPHFQAPATLTYQPADRFWTFHLPT